MIKVIVLTILITVGAVINLYEHGHTFKGSFWAYLFRTGVWLSMVYWFSL